MIMPPLLTLFGKHNNNRTGKTFMYIYDIYIYNEHGYVPQSKSDKLWTFIS